MASGNIKDVAKLAGVGIGTVSRVLNESPNVSDKTRKKVLDAIALIDYKPDPIAQGLKKKATRLVGIIIPRIDNAFFSKLVYYIEQKMLKHDYKLLLCNSKNNSTKEFEYIETLQQHHVQGIFLATDYIRYEDIKAGLPIVAFDRRLENIPYVASDNYKGACLATEKLIHNGCKNLAFLGMITNNITTTSLDIRKEGFIDTCHKYNANYRIFEKKVDFGKENLIAKELFNSNLEFDGVFCSSDTIALHVYGKSKKYNRIVPSDLQIIGYDGLYSTETSFPKLTSIVQPIEEIANAMSDMLIDLIHNGKAEETPSVICEVKLFEGETTK